MFTRNLDEKEANAHDEIAARKREVERIRSRKVSREELERARANFLASEFFERESVSGLASKLGSFHVIGGDWRSEERYFELLKSATADDLQRVAQRYLGTDQLTAGVLVPEAAGIEIDDASVMAAIRAGVESCKREFSVPKRVKANGAAGVSSSAGSKAGGKAKSAGTGKGPAAAKQQEIVSYTLDSGAQLHVKSRRDIPVVAVRAAFLGRLLSHTPETAGIDHSLASTCPRGTRSRPSSVFARAIEDSASGVAGSSSPSRLGV